MPGGEDGQETVYRVIDLETTGFDPADGCKIVEIASVDWTYPKGVHNEQQHFVNPGIPIPPETSAVHHIIDADVAGSPPLEEVLPKYDSEDVIFVAHNAKFEKLFLPEFAEKRQWACTYRAANRVWPDAPSYSNQALRYWLDLPVDRNEVIGMPHRALPDCIVTAALLAKMFETGRATIQDILKWSNLPILKRTCGFGKHAGTEWKDVPKDYLQWIVRKGNFDEDTMHTAKVHLGLVSHA